MKVNIYISNKLKTELKSTLFLIAIVCLLTIIIILFLIYLASGSSLSLTKFAGSSTVCIIIIILIINKLIKTKVVEYKNSGYILYFHQYYYWFRNTYDKHHIFEIPNYLIEDFMMKDSKLIITYKEDYIGEHKKMEMELRGLSSKQKRILKDSLEKLVINNHE